SASWGQSIPDDIFLNNVLPYANVNERRDNVRAQLREKFWPQISDCESISLAAARLNQKVFTQLSVKYSTQRRRADQGPAESMESGLASCTGLSILLIDACRACGIPARFVGTPMWSDNSGNHSWVEIWDDGWHFTGAAEPTGDDLDKGWFTGKASQQKSGDPRYGIFAVSFRRTPIPFPLAWSRRAATEWEVFAEDVTLRYADSSSRKKPGMVELQFKAVQTKGDRCVANLIVRDAQGRVVFRGQTHDESHDANDHLTASLKPGTYSVEWKTDTGTLSRAIQVTSENQLVTLQDSPDSQKSEPASAAGTPGASEPSELQDPPSSSPDSSQVLEHLEAFLESCEGEFERILEQPFASEPLSRSQAEKAIGLMNTALSDHLRKTRREEFESRIIKIGDLEMNFDLRTFGEAPAGGHSLYISMHGGGNAPARVNDRQWENQKRLYELEEGIYIAPRAPTNTWNLWHEAHIDGFFTRLIQDAMLFEGIDPNRVYITGYSAGGDGVFQLAPRMADQLAAAAMMAGHPNETRPEGLRNLPFTLHMGGEDSAYHRNEKAREWKTMLADLRAKDPGGYEHWVEIHEGKPHWMDGQDAEGVRWLAQFTRNMIPQRVVWIQDDVLHRRFYWLAVEDSSAKARSEVTASRAGNQVTIESCSLPEIRLLLRDDMVDLDQDVEVIRSGQRLYLGKVPRTVRAIAQTLIDRGDATAVFTATLPIQLPE
ncbi:MAG: hypothetical protein KDB03_21150, partial [Planctomycetales bacterium]|nr:hypothetical protein [Planctomycetales bacterium]